MTKEQVDKDTGPLDVEMGSGATQVSEAIDAREESPREMDSAFPHSEKHSHAPPQTLTESLPPGPDVTAEGPANHPVGHEAPLTEGNPRRGEVNLTAKNFKRDWISATYQVEEGKFREALATLTPYYRSPDLDPEQQAQLLDDGIARRRGQRRGLRVLRRGSYLPRTPRRVVGAQPQTGGIIRRHPKCVAPGCRR
jgi:hypothetical protein